MSHPLQRRLNRLRRRAGRLLLRYGVSWTVAASLSALLLLGLADYQVRFEDRGIRLMSSLAALAVVGAALYEFCYLSLRRRLSDVQLARRVERRFPRLGERLSSAVEFLRRSEEDRGAGSAALRRSVINDAQAAVVGLDLDEVLDQRPARRAMFAAAALVVVAGLTVALAPRISLLALTRLAKPFGDDRWPRQNELAFQDAPTRLAVGDDFEAELVDRNGRLPDEVRIVYRYENDDAQAPEVDTVHAPGRAIVARKENVTRSFQYRAEGGDDHSMAWRSLEVIEPPLVESFAVKLIPPAYANWPTETSDGQIQALVGSRLEFSGSATKRLASIEWRQGDRQAKGSVAADGLGFRLPAAGAAPLIVEGSGPYWFELTDGEGLVGGKSHHWDLRAIPDAAPSVQIEQPVGNQFVTASAVVSIEVEAKDDLALREITLHYLRSDKSDEGDLRIVLFRGPEQAPPPSEPAGGEGAGRDGVAAGPIAGAQNGDSRTVEYSWSLEPLGLQPGAQVTFFASAGDYLPQRGQSPPRKLTIISPRELEDRVAQRQNQILGEVARALKMQQEARSQVAALEIQMREVGRLAKPDLDRAQAAELNQRQVKRTLTDEQESVPSQIKDLFADLESNRVDSPDLKRRMQELLDQIGQLRDDHLGAIERELTSAIKDSRDADANPRPDGAAPESEKAQKEQTPSGGANGQPNGKPESAEPKGTPSGARQQQAQPSQSDEKPTSAEEQPAATPGEAEKSKEPPSKEPPSKEPQSKEPPSKEPQSNESDKKDADSDPVAKALSAAGEHQDQVIDSLEAMLGRLSQWDNYRRFAREVAQLREQQEEAHKNAREIGAKTLGKEFKDLEPQQQADLKKLAARQRELARQLEKLEQQMSDAKERLGDDDPLASETLGDALQQARSRSLSGKMRQAGDEAEKNQVSQATEKARELTQELDDLINILGNRREQELDRLVRKLREAERDLERLRQRQAGLRKKMAEAAKNANAEERKQQLQRLAHQERQLQEESQRMARRLQRLQSEQAGQRMAGAAGRMGQAGQSGAEGDAAAAEQAAEQAQKDLDDAQSQLAKRRRQAEADLAQEQIARVEDSVKSLRSREARIYEETLRLQQLLEDKGRLTRGEASSVQELARQQKTLEAETRGLADKIASAEVFRLALEGAGDEMRRASDSLARRDTGPATQRAEQSADHRLERIVTALKPDAKKPEGGQQRQNGDDAGEGGEQGGAQGGQDGIRSIAELKLLKALQEDLRDQLRSALDPAAPGSPAERAELLERLAAQQGRLAELTVKLSKPEDANPEDDPDKLPDVREMNEETTPKDAKAPDGKDGFKNDGDE